MTLGQKLAHFWDYHKWQVLAAVVVLAILGVCVGQSCAHRPADYTLMYAGEGILSANGAQTLSESTRAAGDLGGSVECYHYFIDMHGGGGTSGQNLETFDQEILAGKAVILLLSPDLYARVYDNNGGILPLGDYLPADLDPALYFDENHAAIRLSALPLYALPGYASLPADTLLCLRSPVSVTALLRRRQAEDAHRAYAELFTRLVTYEAE